MVALMRSKRVFGIIITGILETAFVVPAALEYARGGLTTNAALIYLFLATYGVYWLASIFFDYEVKFAFGTGNEIVPTDPWFLRLIAVLVGLGLWVLAMFVIFKHWI